MARGQRRAGSRSSRPRAEREDPQARREAAVDSLNAYIREIAKFKPLSADEEKELGRRIREGDQEALKRLVEANLRFVVSLREALPRPRAVLPGPHPRGHPRPDRGGQALRPRAQRQVHLLRGVVGAPGDLPRALRARARLPPAPEAVGPGLAAADRAREAEGASSSGTPTIAELAERTALAEGGGGAAAARGRATTCRSRPRWATTAASSSATRSSRTASPPSRWR